MLNDKIINDKQVLSGNKQIYGMVLKAPINSQNSTVSIVIPVLNNKEGLTKAIESIIKQAYSLVEIIVIDGGSCDGTLDEIRKLDDVIDYWESGLDSGIADAFNRGISRAKGDVVAILNSDDYWHKDTLKHIVNAYKQSPGADVFYGDLQFLDEVLGNFYVKKPNIKKMKYRMNVFHPAMFVKRSAYEKVGLYRLDFKHAMDSEWCHRALEMGLKFDYVPHVLATMRLGGVSDREFKQSLQEYRQSIIQHRLEKTWKAWVYYYYFFTMKTIMKVSCLRKLKHKLHNGT